MNWFKIFIFVFVVQVIRSDRNCTGRMLLEKFQLSSKGFLEVCVNTSLTIECQLDKRAIQSGCNASYLSFQYGVTTIVTDGVQDLINNSLHLIVDTSRATSLTVTCTYNGSGLNSEVLAINVGVNPQPINLKCLVYKLKKLTCSYDMSSNPVNEDIMIEMLNQATDTYELVHFNFKKETQQWHFEVNRIYGPFDQFKFRVSVSNSIGPKIRQIIKYGTDQIVVLPSNFMIEQNVTLHKVIVLWSFPEMYNKYEYNHTRDCEPGCLKNLNSGQVKTSRKTGPIIFELELDLPLANAEYNLDILTCVKNATIWTEQCANVKSIFNSSKRIPDSPPQIVRNAFEYIENTNDVKFYWKPILAKYKNGDNYAIKVQEIRQNGVRLANINVTLSDTWARLHRLNPKMEYEIRLIATNSEGVSNNFSSITIPKNENLLEPPQNLKIILNETIPQLSWSSNGPVDHFTICWCKPLDEQKSNCQEFIGCNKNLITGDRTSFKFTKQFNYTSSKIIAISSNLNGNTSGMKWFTCITSTKTEMATIDNAFIYHINGTTIKVHWTLPCETSPLLTAITIFYCKLELYETEMCKTNFQHPINRTSEALIGKLAPNTDYILELAMFDGWKKGPVKQIRFKTDNGVPDAPTDLRHGTITNNSVEIFWTPPKKWYGHPQYYNISSNATKFGSNYQRIDLKNRTSLVNLRSSTEYIIRVAACHDTCSAFSNEIEIKTKMGKPGNVTRVEVDGIYKWALPTVKNGDFQLYEIKFNVSHDAKYETRISLMSVTQCTRTLPEDVCKYDTYIRAINLNEPLNTNKFANSSVDTAKVSSNCLEELNTTYTELCSFYECIPGDWMLIGNSYCPPSYTIKILFYTIVSLVLFGIIYVAMKFCMQQYKVITDIHVSIPLGLDNLFDPAHQKCDIQPAPNTRPDSSDRDDDIASQIITSEELQSKLEMHDLQEDKNERCPNFSITGYYMQQTHQQNDGYVRISELT